MKTETIEKTQTAILIPAAKVQSIYDDALAMYDSQPQASWGEVLEKAKRPKDHVYDQELYREWRNEDDIYPDQTWPSESWVKVFDEEWDRPKVYSLLFNCLCEITDTQGHEVDLWFLKDGRSNLAKTVLGNLQQTLFGDDKQFAKRKMEDFVFVLGDYEKHILADYPDFVFHQVAN